MVQLCQIVYKNHVIKFQLERRTRKTLEISVYPDMTVKVIAPVDSLMQVIIEKVERKAVWILGQIRFFERFHPKHPERCYLAGESHLYLGREYRLKLVSSMQKQVKLSRGYLCVETHSPGRPDVTQYILEQWYLKQARIKFSERLDMCLKAFSNQEQFQPKNIIVRQLSNRWGSMTEARNLVLNRQLIKSPIECIDYVIIHELCHLRHRNHDRNFYQLLHKIMPDWQKQKNRLENLMVNFAS